MSEDVQTTTEPGQQEKTDSKQNEEGVSLNAQAKNLPWVQDLMKKAARADALEQAEKQRHEEQEKATRAAELEKAKAEERYEDALRLQREESAREIAALKHNALTNEIKAALLAEGSRQSEGFFKVAVAEYDSEKHASVSDFVKQIKADENYAIFFGSSEKVPPPNPPGKLPVSGHADNPSWEQVKAWEKSDDREKRIKAREYISQYRKEHGEYPY